jgi:hypothetical protein
MNRCRWTWDLGPGVTIILLPAMTTPDEEAAFLERVRRSGISIDREGELWHEGEIVRHEGLRSALFRWLDRQPPPDGRYVLRLDERRFAFLEDVADTPLVVRALRWDGNTAMLALSDGSAEPLDRQTLTQDDDGVLRCWVRQGRLEARLSNSAAVALADGMGDALAAIRRREAARR